MILPTKHLDLDSCVVACASTVLQSLSKSGSQRYDALQSEVEKQHGDSATTQFLYSLDLLFLLGLVRYHAEIDALSLVTPSEGAS